MPDSNVIRIKEVAATSQYLNRPLRGLSEVAEGQERLAKLRAEQNANGINRDAIQLLRDLYARDDFRCSMSREDRARIEEIVLKAGGF